MAMAPFPAPVTFTLGVFSTALLPGRPRPRTATPVALVPPLTAASMIAAAAVVVVVVTAVRALRIIGHCEGSLNKTRGRELGNTVAAYPYICAMYRHQFSESLTVQW